MLSAAGSSGRRWHLPFVSEITVPDLPPGSRLSCRRPRGSIKDRLRGMGRELRGRIFSSHRLVFFSSFCLFSFSLGERGVKGAVSVPILEGSDIFPAEVVVAGVVAEATSEVFPEEVDPVEVEEPAEVGDEIFDRTTSQVG